ncbi:hypothetical protein SeLEV6574_g05276 [Synchytrium endobioticum]|uniref:Uncharacterized protein n=1 Tax=Synchytrium endobioticum TaxID=286115 RepID=A0A507CVI0_9FUNG|nr:hypothetical protein SeLEV6574_g05276 [Synchytrium endobioticum]
MERPINIVLIAIVAFLTLVEFTLAVSDSSDIKCMTALLCNRCCAVVRRQGTYIESPLFAFLATHPTPTSLLDKAMNNIAAKCVPTKSPYTINELFAPPDPVSMNKLQLRLARAYHACVFEKLKSFFMNLQTYIAGNAQSNRVLPGGLTHVWNVLKLQHRLAEQYQFYVNVTNVRRLKLPSYVSEPDASDRVAKFHRQASETRSRCIKGYIKRINELRLSLEPLMTAVGEHHSGRDFRMVTGRILATDTKKRFVALANTIMWTSTWTYATLNEVPITVLRLLPVRIAHERLIIDRARYDMKRLQIFGDDFSKKLDKVSVKLREYEEFIGGHAEKIRLYEQTLRGGDAAGDTIIAVPYTTNDGIAQAHLQHDLPTGQFPINFNVVERHQDDSDQPAPVMIGGIGGTSDPMVTSTDDIYRPMLDLLGQDREDDSDAPPSGMIDFLGKSDEQALTLSLGTYNPERYEASTSGLEKSFLSLSSVHGHDAESSTHSHNARAKGKRSMHDVGSPPGYAAHHAYGNLGYGYPRKKKGQ